MNISTHSPRDQNITFGDLEGQLDVTVKVKASEDHYHDSNDRSDDNPRINRGLFFLDFQDSLLGLALLPNASSRL